MQLDQYRHLFRDEAAFNEFVEAIRLACHEERPIALERRVIGFMKSARFTKEMLAKRCIERFIKHPELLDDLINRLGSDEIAEDY